MGISCLEVFQLQSHLGLTAILLMLQERTAWVKRDSEGNTEMLGEQTRLNTGLSTTNPIRSGRDRHESAAVKNQRLTDR